MANGDLNVTMEGLEPGSQAQAMFSYTPDDGTGGRNTGFDQKVRGNGTVKFQTDYTEVVAGKNRPGQLRVEITTAVE